MRSLPIFALIGVASLATPTTAQGGSTLLFDLIEINDEPNPLHPGIDFTHHPAGLYRTEVAQESLVDFDNDGWLDVFLANTEGWPNHLYVNQGDGTFSEEAAARGVDEPSKRRGSCLFIDVENDGDLDLVTCGFPGSLVPNYDLHTLFRNDGAPSWTFTDVTASGGGFALAQTTEGTLLGDPGGATAADYNRDGFLDFFVNYFWLAPDHLHDQPRLWKNLPNPVQEFAGQTDYSVRIFADATVEAGLDAYIDGWSHSSHFVDVNKDSYADLHICLDTGMDVMRLNNGDGTFGADIGTSSGMNGDPAEPRNEMGMAIGDIDFDQDLDFYLTNAYQNDRLYRNDSTFDGGSVVPAFADKGPDTGTAKSNFGWGASFGDIDNDSDLDLLVSTGMAVPFTNLFFENQWPALAADAETPMFADKSAEVPDFMKDGAEGTDIAKGLGMFDFDRDGDLDIVATRYSDGPLVTPGTHQKTAFYLNTLSSSRHWIQVDLRELGGSRNTVGARVFVQAGDKIQTREVLVGTSYNTQEPYRLHFGLGDEAIDWICVRWLDGTHTAISQPASDQVMLIERQPGIGLPVDVTGDLDGSGTLTAYDHTVLVKGARRPKAVEAAYSTWPWKIVGDINGNGIIDKQDGVLLLQLLP